MKECEEGRRRRGRKKAAKDTRGGRRRRRREGSNNHHHNYLQEPPNLLQLTRQQVNFQKQIGGRLSLVQGMATRVDEPVQLLPGSGGLAVEDLVHLRSPSIDADDQADELALGTASADIQNTLRWVVEGSGPAPQTIFMYQLRDDKAKRVEGIPE